MRSFSESLSLEMEAQLAAIHAQSNDPLHYAPLSVKYLIGVLEKLKSFCLRYEFSGKSEEIEFFREVKPRFVSKLIYYNEVYSIAVNKPFGCRKQLRKYYKSTLLRLDAFFDTHWEFCRYYRSGNSEFDKQYFLRRQLKLPLTFDNAYLHSDHRFSTAHDYTVARIWALNGLREYLEEAMPEINQDTVNIPKKGIQLSWTAPKVSLVELIYALHADGVFAHGRSDLKTVILAFEQVFGINLGQYHKTFLEIRERKSDKAKFLNSLRERLLQRIDDADAL